nr:immunoglobulin heavy chain junction region [Mus musculus]
CARRDYYGSRAMDYW